jgi:hypothetical protein
MTSPDTQGRLDRCPAATATLLAHARIRDRNRNRIGLRFGYPQHSLPVGH